ncbi:MAG: hypothetical protein ACLQVJ_13130 [Syntrophobacteraceae bacterium]
MEKYGNFWETVSIDNSELSAEDWTLTTIRSGLKIITVGQCFESGHDLS